MATCLSFSTHGPAREVLSLQSFEWVEPLALDEVRIECCYAPINPADLNSIEGTYGRSPRLPAVAGHEGIGRVAELGAGIADLELGDWVLPLCATGCWSSQMRLQRCQLLRLPRDVDPIQACMLRVNPATAWLLIDQHQQQGGDGWLALNASNSAVGECVIALASQRGVPTLAFVRNESQVPALMALGATAAFTDDAKGFSEAKLRMKSEPGISTGLNAVGGDSALRMLELLRPGGELITYGAMSKRSLKVSNRMLIFDDLRLSGFWLSRWYQTQSQDQIAGLLTQLARLQSSGRLPIRIDSIHPMSSYLEAIERAQQGGRSGKVLLELGGS